jgi:hypothetical protein
MAGPYSPLLPDGTAWLRAIGQRLRAEYDALAGPMPPHLMALLDRLAAPAEREVQGCGSFALPSENQDGPPPRRCQPSP